MLSQYDDPEFALAVLDGGSEGRAYLLKERMSDPTQLLGAIRSVASYSGWRMRMEPCWGCCWW